VFIVVLGLSALTMAQSTTTGAIGGVVQNQIKLCPEPWSKSVTLKPTRKIPLRLMTGRFKVSNLQPGKYAVTIDASGFTQLRRKMLWLRLVAKRRSGRTRWAGYWHCRRHAEAPVINTAARLFEQYQSNVDQRIAN
jgi:hypothetical protein